MTLEPMTGVRCSDCHTEKWIARGDVDGVWFEATVCACDRAAPVVRALSVIDLLNGPMRDYSNDRPEEWR